MKLRKLIEVEEERALLVRVHAVHTGAAVGVQEPAQSAQRRGLACSLGPPVDDVRQETLTISVALHRWIDLSTYRPRDTLDVTTCRDLGRPLPERTGHNRNRLPHKDLRPAHPLLASGFRS